MSVKETLKKVPVLYPMVRHLKGGLKDAKTIPNYLQERRIHRTNAPIRVGFICQYIPVWHKLQPIYEAMREDERFDPILICVPSGVKDGVLQESTQENDTLDYFQTHGYPEALNALQSDGLWMDLEKMDLSYVFYPRPYDYHMPVCYQSRYVSRYCRICIILYGMNTTKEIVRVTLNRGFFRNVYCYFAELPFSKEQNTKMGWLLHFLGLQRSEYFGMPGVEVIQKAEQQKRPAWDFAKNDFRVMWTPRWTTDLSLGGTNFFTYYRFLLDYARLHPDCDFLFRPHPLALQHFLETGEMTQQEVDAFLETCQVLPNVSLDTEKEYAATFWGTSVLISDISGIIPEYAVTGQPLIFCASNMELTPEDSTARILEGSYIVNNEQELANCLSQLKQGIDPLKEKRLQIARELFGEEYAKPAQKTVEFLAYDALRRRK